MSLSRLVKRCDQLVRAVSGFSDYLWNEMMENHDSFSTKRMYHVQEDGSFGNNLEDRHRSLNISYSFDRFSNL